MAKGLYIFDPEAKEFRRRGSARPWDLKDEMVLIDDVESNEPVVSPKNIDPADQQGPAGFVDPTPLRRRRSKKKPLPRPNSTDSVSKKWRWVMWILIVVMALTWLVMVYMHSRKAREFPRNEKFFHFDRQEILNE